MPSPGPSCSCSSVCSASGCCSPRTKSACRAAAVAQLAPVWICACSVTCPLALSNSARLAQAGMPTASAPATKLDSHLHRSRRVNSV